MSARNWDEKLHPRDLAGKFSSGGGGGRSVNVTTMGPDGRHVTTRSPMDLNTSGVKGGEGGRRREGLMSDAKYQARAARVGATMKPLSDPRSPDYAGTDRKYKVGDAWSPERARVHAEIVDELYKKASGVPNDGRALIAGGLGGAGKSTVLRDHAGVDQSQFLTINPDDVKELLAERGLIPEVPGSEDFSPMERAALVHEESSDIGKMLAARAYADRKNVIWDITMSSEGSVNKRIAEMSKAGYGSISGVFVDIPVNESVERAMERWARGIKDFQAGKGFGGRYVPPEIIRKQETSSGKTVNRGVFEQLKNVFSGWQVWDNSVYGRDPVLIEGSESD